MSNYFSMKSDDDYTIILSTEGTDIFKYFDVSGLFFNYKDNAGILQNTVINDDVFQNINQKLESFNTNINSYLQNNNLELQKQNIKSFINLKIIQLNEYLSNIKKSKESVFTNPQKNLNKLIIEQRQKYNHDMVSKIINILDTEYTEPTQINYTDISDTLATNIITEMRDTIDSFLFPNKLSEEEVEKFKEVLVNEIKKSTANRKLITVQQKYLKYKTKYLNYKNL